MGLLGTTTSQNTKVVNTKYKLVKNDVGNIISFTIVDKNMQDTPTPMDLTDATVFLNVKRGDFDLVRWQCEITEPELGKCIYVIKEDDLQYGNCLYELEIEICYPDGSIISSEKTIKIWVREDLD